jgi:hypothetical protein
MLAELEAHLHNLSNETDTIAATLDEGVTALNRLEEQVEAVNAAAGQGPGDAGGQRRPAEGGMGAERHGTG